jgi:hypothetical protein
LRRRKKKKGERKSHQRQIRGLSQHVSPMNRGSPKRFKCHPGSRYLAIEQRHTLNHKWVIITHVLLRVMHVLIIFLIIFIFIKMPNYPLMHSIIKNNHDKKMKKPLKVNLVRFAFRDTLVILFFFFK